MKAINILLGTAAAIAMTSCCSNKTEAEQKFVTDSVTFEQKDNIAEVTIFADYPTATTKELKTAIAEYISETLGAQYMGTLENGDSIIDYYGKAIYQELAKEHKEMEAEMPFMTDYKFNKTTETENYVTYTSAYEEYMGGAHGSTIIQGATFRKADGRKFGLDMLVGTEKEKFRALLKEGLKEYFDNPNMTDTQLKEYLFLNESQTVDYLPLPAYAPYITDKGVTFTYQQYEIASYAAGLPTFTIPFEKIKPYLSATVLKMVKQ